MDEALIRRIRSRLIEDGGCLIWPGAMASHSSPQIRFEGQMYAVRRVLYERDHGPVPDGMVIAVKCECQRCVRHIGPMTTKEVRQRAAQSGALAPVIHGPRVAAGRRHHRKHSEEFIAALRASDVPTMELSRELGISFSYLYKVRKGEARRHDVPNPFSGLIAANTSRRDAA